MARCEVCGNDYDLAFEIHAQGSVHVFDCFECAIHGLAPRCDNCDVTMIGHGVAAGGRMFCCASCAAAGGAQGAVDRV